MRRTICKRNIRVITPTAQSFHGKAQPKNASLGRDYWKELVAQKYKAKGYKVEKEVPIGEGKAVDLVPTKANQRIAIEIETGNSDVEANVKRCKEGEFGKVVVVCTKKRNSWKRSSLLVGVNSSA